VTVWKILSERENEIVIGTDQSTPVGMCFRSPSPRRSRKVPGMAAASRSRARNRLPSCDQPRCSAGTKPGRIGGVSVQLNHTIVSCRDQQRSAAFLTGILGLPPASRFGHFLVVEADNGVSLDFAETGRDIAFQHYAFLVSEEEFDASFGRIQHQELPYWADPGKTQRGAVNHRDGGRGLYFEDPDGHLLEIITRP